VPVLFKQKTGYELRYGDWSSDVLCRSLNLNAVCDQCNAILHKGSRAGIGVRDQPGPRAIICPQCLAALSRAGATPAKARR
jgi:hypothetical protein